MAVRPRLSSRGADPRLTRDGSPAIPQEKIQGFVIITTKGSFEHKGISLLVEGAVHMTARCVLLPRSALRTCPHRLAPHPHASLALTRALSALTWAYSTRWARP